MSGRVVHASSVPAPRRLWSGLLLRVLERDPAEIVRRASRFAIRSDHGRDLVARLGEAFLGGYNTMLRTASIDEVARQGLAVEAHFRPFFFEGAAMGYLPRGWLSAGYDARSVERDLHAMHPDYRYLYYVGLGFWFGMRHPRDPSRIERLAPYLDPIYLPLCYDGFGFKTGFFDFPTRPGALRRLDRVPAQYRAAAWQGFGRALFFVYMDDPEGFDRLRDRLPAAHREDLETGRALALAFTGVDHPARLLAHLDAAVDDRQRAARLLGITWALTAREMTDAAYLKSCLASGPAAGRHFLAQLPPLCRNALATAGDYAGWQQRTREAAVRLDGTRPDVLPAATDS